MNIYHTKYYQKHHNKQEKIIFKKLENESIRKLENGFYVISKNYSNINNNIHYKGSNNTLYNDKNEELYNWSNIDNNNNTIYYFKHTNNFEYLIYHEDLYGYSIININTLETSHYIPKKSFNIKNWDDETFIWINYHYIKDKNLLLVLGCIWGGPGEFILVDLKEPLKIQKSNKWIYSEDIFPNYWKKYQEVNYVKYKNNKIYLKLTETNNKEIEKTISYSQILELLKNKN